MKLTLEDITHIAEAVSAILEPRFALLATKEDVSHLQTQINRINDILVDMNRKFEDVYSKLFHHDEQLSAIERLSGRQP